MIIIDANNLAGKLKMLGESDFDQKLIRRVENYYSKNKVALVFDSSDPMGDKISKRNLIVYYTPKDNYYKDADDKIVELVDKEITKSSLGRQTEEVVVITDDIDLTKRIEKINKDNGASIQTKKVTWLADRIIKNEHYDESEDEEKRGLADDKVDDINQELINIWR